MLAIRLQKSPMHDFRHRQLFNHRRPPHTMKSCTPTYLLAIAVTVVSVWSLKAQLNKPASIVLPPKSWDISKHILVSLVTTNKPGDYALRPAWVGVDKVTVRTGWHTNEDEMARQTNRWFRFDRLTVCSGHIFPAVPEDRYICNATNEFSREFSYRPSLPTDDELLEIRDVSAVTNLCGWNPFFKMTNGVGQEVGMGYFTLTPYNSIETLDASFYNKRGSSKIDSIIVRRGHFHQ